MERPEVVQALLNRYEKPAYLEIGVSHGLTFHDVSADRKVAVDPKFQFDVAARAQEASGSTYHEITSDDYFARAKKKETFEVIFLDGLHTYDQTLRDLMNAMDCLAAGGVILIDDVIPTSYSASLPTLDDVFAFREATGFVDHAWMGDVYRLVFFVRDYLPGFAYATIEENHGQTVLWRAAPRMVSEPRTLAAISALTYGDAMRSKSVFQLKPFQVILNEIDGAQT